MKKLLMSFLIVVGLCLLMTSPAQSKTNNHVFVDTLLVDMPHDPFILNHRLMVPFRSVFEALEYQIEWHNQDKKVIGQKGDLIIELTIDNHTAYVNGELVYIDVPPTNKNGITYVPLRFIGEASNYEVIWDGTHAHVFTHLREARILQAIERDAVQDVSDIINKYRVDIHLPLATSHDTVLTYAIKNNATKTASLLLELEASANMHNKLHEHPLELAFYHKNNELIFLLLEKDAYLDHSYQTGMSPLFLAIHYDMEDVFKTLLEKGANTLFPAKDGQDVYHFIKGYTDKEAFLRIIETSIKPEEFFVNKHHRSANIASQEIFNFHLMHYAIEENKVYALLTIYNGTNENMQLNLSPLTERIKLFKSRPTDPMPSLNFEHCQVIDHSDPDSNIVVPQLDKACLDRNNKLFEEHKRWAEHNPGAYYEREGQGILLTTEFYSTNQGVLENFNLQSRESHTLVIAIPIKNHQEYVTLEGNYKLGGIIRKKFSIHFKVDEPVDMGDYNAMYKLDYSPGRGLEL